MRCGIYALRAGIPVPDAVAGDYMPRMKLAQAGSAAPEASELCCKPVRAGRGAVTSTAGPYASASLDEAKSVASCAAAPRPSRRANTEIIRVSQKKGAAARCCDTIYDTVTYFNNFWHV